MDEQLTRLQQGVAPASAAAAAVPEGAVESTPLSARERATLQEQARNADAIAAWRQVRNGMTRDEVRALLGAPQSQIPAGNRTGWYYAYGADGGASVFFDHDGHVISTMAPRAGAFRLY